VRINKLSNARHDVIYWLAPLDDLYLKIAHRRVRSSSDSLHTHSFISPNWQPNTENTENKQTV